MLPNGSVRPVPRADCTLTALPIDSISDLMAKPKAVPVLRAALVKRGWTQNELARQLGTDTAVVSRWMTGRRKPGLELALKLEDLLGVQAQLWVDAA